MGNFISFLIGATDAISIAKEFYPIFREDDLVSLLRYSIYLKLMSEGATSKPFSEVSVPWKKPKLSMRNE